MDVDDHAEELASALGVDTQEVKEDLENLLQYSVPIDEAKQSIRRKYGGGSDGGGGAAPQAVDVADVTPDHGNVTVTARVLTVGTRSIRYEGEEQVIREGQLADTTGRISYTAWQEFGFDPGDTVTIGNAGVREWEGEPELNLGAETTVALESDALDVPFPVGGESALADLSPGDRGRTVEVRVLELERRTIDGRDGETDIWSGVLGDESGRLPFTDWEARPGIEAGADIHIEDVYVREYRGVPSVNLSEFTEVTTLSEPVGVAESAPRVSIDEAVASGGMFDVEVVGNVIEVRDGSGLIERCPDCSRVLQNGQCRAHGEVDGEDDMRIKAIIDDGTATVTAVLDRDLTEAVYGDTMEAAMAAAREAMDREVVAETIREAVVGLEARVRGTLSVDEYGANLEADVFDLTDEDPEARARAVLSSLNDGGATGTATDGGVRGGDRK